MKVFPSLVKRRKNHFHNLPCGVSIIIGNNGFIWLSPQKQDVLYEGNKDEIEEYDLQVNFLCNRTSYQTLNSLPFILSP